MIDYISVSSVAGFSHTHDRCDIIADRHNRGRGQRMRLSGLCCYLHLGYGLVLTAGTICGFVEILYDFWVSKMPLIIQPFGGYTWVYDVFRHTPMQDTWMI